MLWRVCVTHQHQDRGSPCPPQVQWGVQWGSLEAADGHKVNDFHSRLSSSSRNLGPRSVRPSPVVVGGGVVVGGRVVVIFLPFFFPFLSVLGFLVALGSFGSLFFFLSFFFFLPSSGALLTLLENPGKNEKGRQEKLKTHLIDFWSESK